MMPFTCPTCKAETKRLIACKDGRGDLGCPECYTLTIGSPAYLHQLAEGAKGDRSYTVAKDMLIDRRVLSKDKTTSIDRNTGRQSQY
jgi:hypothetical protein